jgi:hypothetical protein
VLLPRLDLNHPTPPGCDISTSYGGAILRAVAPDPKACSSGLRLGMQAVMIERLIKIWIHIEGITRSQVRSKFDENSVGSEVRESTAKTGSLAFISR